MRKIQRHIQRRFSISAPRLAVKPHMPWYIRWGLLTPVILLVGWAGWQAYDSGLELAGFHRVEAETELSRLKQQVASLQEENAKLNSQVVADERQIQMDHAAATELEQQLKSLNDEKAHLNEDLAFFQNLTQSGSREESLTIHRVSIVRDSLPGEYHCSMLLVQSGQRQKEFRGSLQLVVNVLHNGEKSVVVFPQDAAKDGAAYQLDFKYYQRIERSFKLSPDVFIESVQVRVYERGVSEPKIKQDVSLS